MLIVNHVFQSIIAMYQTLNFCFACLRMHDSLSSAFAFIEQLHF